MPGDDHWLNCSNANRPNLFHYPLHGWLHPLSLRSVLIMLRKHWHYTLNTSKVNINNGPGHLLLTVWSTQCYYWRLQVVARLSDFYLRTWKKIFYVLVKNILPLMCCYCCVLFSVGLLFICAVLGSNKQFFAGKRTNWYIYQHFKYGTISVFKDLTKKTTVSQRGNV